MEALETEVPEIYGKLVLKYRPTSFVVVISGSTNAREICFQGKEQDEAVAFIQNLIF
ncbi:MAG TPA: hypothetical protein VIG33_12660 [Pseudobdellovibrionaceae bacterium]|jgi:hypothetical protein